MKKILTTCPYCGTGCGMYLIVENDEVVAVEASAAHPVAAGKLCVKGWNAFQFINHHERLTTPLIKKDNQFIPATWDEALSLIATKLKTIQSQYGSDSVMFMSSARATNEENYLLMKLARAVFKTNNVDHCARLCHASTVAGLAATFGSGAMTNSISCMEQADCFLVIGTNTTEQHPLIGTRVLQRVQNGAQLIVADSRAIQLTHFADLHLRHRNGTDVALLNSLMHVIIRDNLENKQFVAERTENYEELKIVVSTYTPEKVATICGISAQEIVNAAHIFAEAKSAMIIYAMGITQHVAGIDNVKSIANLAMLTGNIGKVGSGVNPLRGQNNVQGACDMGALPDFYSGYQLVTDRKNQEKFARAWHVENLPTNIGYAVTSALDAVAEGKIKACFIMGENPVMSEADQHHVIQALEKLEFLVVQDIFFTPTCKYADVILPAASFAEKDGTFTNTERRVQQIRKAVSPVGESKADWEILCTLAKRCGYEYMNYAHPAAIMEEIASLTPIYGGISYPRLACQGLQWPCLDANHPGTPILHTKQFSRGRGKFMPAEYFAPPETPDQEYPFLLSTGRCYFQYHTGTMTRRTRLLEREEHFPYVEINNTDAKKLNIRDRDWINIITRRGKVAVMARISDITAGIIFMPFHFEEGAANKLTINARDKIAEIPEFKVCAAKIEKKL